MIREICVDSYLSAKTAVEVGAEQVELVSMTSVGGVTPSYGLIKKVLELPIRTMVMIRPRAAGFCYSEEDKAVMLEDVAMAKEMGAQGIVFGALKEDRSLDEEWIRKIVKEAGSMEIVFHRAFEVIEDKIAAAKTLRDLGVHRILTKGGNSLEEGKEILKQLIQIPGIQIISGGIRPHTIDLVKEIGLNYVHISSNKNILDPSTSGTGIYYGTTNSPEDEYYPVADREYLKGILQALSD
ncbi:MAG: copper homeostasis protein CutC [Tissierellia bacterium]|nr:copper homeostasis protein CutC [Tissierellia bacterium]